MKKLFLLLAAVFATQQLLAKEIIAPLLLNINGHGRVLPYHNGQILSFGPYYKMAAIPDPGYKFVGWERIEVFTFDVWTQNANGKPVESVSTDVSTSGVYTTDPVLVFTPQLEKVVGDIPDYLIVTESTGWQADFAPIYKWK